MKRYTWILLAVTVVSLAWASRAYAQQPVPSDDQVNAIARQLFCPVCENTPLDVCPTQACAQWRELIRQKLADGWTADQIKQYFAEQYGARVLSEPPKQGMYWLVYILPYALGALGIYILYRAFISMRKAPVAVTAAPEDKSETPSGDDYVRKVEEELKKRN